MCCLQSKHSKRSKHLGEVVSSGHRVVSWATSFRKLSIMTSDTQQKWATHGHMHPAFITCTSEVQAMDPDLVLLGASEAHVVDHSVEDAVVAPMGPPAAAALAVDPDLLMLVLQEMAHPPLPAILVYEISKQTKARQTHRVSTPFTIQKHINYHGKDITSVTIWGWCVARRSPEGRRGSSRIARGSTSSMLARSEQSTC